MATRTTGRAEPTSQDRQRDRTARGVAAPGAGATTRPNPPTRRRPAVALLGVLLILGGAALAGLLALRMDSREPVLALRTDVPAGTEITRDVLSQTNVAADSRLLVPVDSVGSVLGTYTKVPLNEGQLLDTSMLVQDNPLASGDVAEVGVPLVDGRVPSGLDSGDLVRVVRVGESSSPGTPLAIALVLRVQSGGGGGGSLVGGGDDDAPSAATLLVPVEVADAIVDAAGNNTIGMSLVDRGVPATATDQLRSLVAD